MLKAVMHPFEKWKRTDRAADGPDIRSALGKEAAGHFERLKAKFPKLSEDRLITLALKHLDRKTDVIIHRRLLRRIRNLKNRGLSVEQIAEHFNRQEVPSLTGAQRWRGEEVGRVLEGRKRVRTERNDA